MRTYWLHFPNEEVRHGMVEGLTFTAVHSDEMEEGILGRSDVVIQTEKDVFVLELKVDGTVEEAFAQIDDTDYAVQWSADGRRVWFVH